MALDAPAMRPYGHDDLGSHYQGQVEATESRYGADALTRCASSSSDRDGTRGLTPTAVAVSHNRIQAARRPKGGHMTGTETQAHRQAAHRRRLPSQTVTVTDNRTGRSYELPITDGTLAWAGLPRDQTSDRGLRPDGLRPRIRQRGVVSQRHHLPRRRQGDPALPGLSDRAAGRALHLPRGRLPADPRRAAHERRSWRSGRTRSRSTPSCTRTSRASCRASATTPTRWGCCWARWERSPPSIPTPTRSTTPRSATSRRSG